MQIIAMTLPLQGVADMRQKAGTRIAMVHQKIRHMQKEDIRLEDVKRILIGNAPPVFLLEVLIRALCVYLLVLVVVKLLGKRMSGQLTLIEMAVLIMLGGIIGSPMQVPERGILTGMLILFLILLFHNIVNRTAFKYGKFEKVTQGEARMLVKDGVLVLEQLDRERVSTQQLFSLLRDQEVRHLGEVKRVYLESSGLFSIYKASNPPPGLSVYPLEDAEIFRQYAHCEKDQHACTRCGAVSGQNASRCPRCGYDHFIAAIR